MNNMIQELKMTDLCEIYGGNDGAKQPTRDTQLAYDIAYGVGAFFRGLWEFCKTASEYQSSLPSTLKK